jgi:hypothetical protein
VLFNEHSIQKLTYHEQLQHNDEKKYPVLPLTKVTAGRRNAVKRLLNLPNIINQAIGDALSDILLVEAILRHKNWSISQWDAIYTDLPNRLRYIKTWFR